MALASEQWNKTEHFWKQAVAMEVSLATWPALVFKQFEDFSDVFQITMKEKS